MGNYIVISHGNGVCTVYEHCSSLYVSEGDYVSQGQTIAAVGSTGISTGAHLHFGVTVGGEYVNPLYYVIPELFREPFFLDMRFNLSSCYCRTSSHFCPKSIRHPGG